MTVLTLLRTELRRLTATRLAVLAFVVLMTVPLLYGGLYLWGNRDPYANLDKVPAALVVADTGVTTGGTTTNYGRSVADSLERRGTFDWQRMSAAEAGAAVRDGRVDFVLTLPASFSRDLASVSTAQPTRARVQLDTSDANGYLSSTIAANAATAVRDSVAAQVGRTAASKFLVGLASVRGSLTDAAGSAGTLASGAGRVAAGAAKVDAAAARLVTGARGTASGAAAVASGSAALGSGLQRIDAGSAVTDAALRQRLAADGLSPAQIAEALAVLAPGQAAVHEAAGSAGTLATGAARASSGASAVSTGAARLAAGTGSLATGAASARSGAATLAAGASKVASGADSVASGTRSLASGAGSLATGLDRLERGTTALSSGATLAASGAASLTVGAKSVAIGARQLHDGLSAGGTKIPATSATSRTAQAAAVGDPAGVHRTSVTSAGTYGAGLAPFFLSLATWIGAYSLFLIVRPLSRRAISAVGRPLRVTLAGWLTPALLGVVQVVGLYLLATGPLGFSVANPLGMLGVLALTAFAFSSILLLLNAALGSAGQFLGLVLMLVQLVVAGGTFPWQTLPAPLAALHRLLPMSYAVDALRQVMYGGDAGLAWRDAAVLGVFLIASLALTTAIAARMTRHRTLRDLQPSLIGG